MTATERRRLVIDTFDRALREINRRFVEDPASVTAATVKESARLLALFVKSHRDFAAEDEAETARKAVEDVGAIDEVAARRLYPAIEPAR
jgi:hypothetical protein